MHTLGQTTLIEQSFLNGWLIDGWILEVPLYILTYTCVQMHVHTPCTFTHTHAHTHTHTHYTQRVPYSR